MSNKTPRSTSRKSSDLIRIKRGESPRRTSSRHQMSSNDKNLTSKVLAPSLAVKRSITVRKIVPRKTQVSSDSNKENVERLSEMSVKSFKTLTTATDTSNASKVEILSPVLPSSSPSSQPRESEQDLIWSQKVRAFIQSAEHGDMTFESPKSLSASSSSINSRETLFGFERLLTPEVMRKTEVSRVALQGSMSFTLGSFNISAADDSISYPPELDPNIPGVCLVKKTKRKRVQQIKMSELDDLAAKMNAEFEEAENFELVVE